MSFAIVQHGHNASTPTLSDTVTLGAAPTAGNLLLIFVQYFQVVTDAAINTAKYTIESGHSSSATDQMWILSRYADGTETATLPTFQTSATTYFSATVVEISGVSGTHARDFEKVQLDNASASAGTVTSTSYTALNANDFAVTGYCGDGSGGGISSISAGWTADESQGSGATIGYSYGVAHQAVATAGTAVQNTVTFVANNSGRNIGLVVLKPAAGAETGTATLVFGGVKFAASGTARHSGTAAVSFGGIGFVASGAAQHKGTAALAFSGVAFSGAGGPENEGVGALAFSGVAFSGAGGPENEGVGALAFRGLALFGSGFDAGVPGGGVRQFWTFQ